MRSVVDLVAVIGVILSLRVHVYSTDLRVVDESVLVASQEAFDVISIGLYGVRIAVDSQSNNACPLEVNVVAVAVVSGGYYEVFVFTLLEPLEKFESESVVRGVSNWNHFGGGSCCSGIAVHCGIRSDPAMKINLIVVESYFSPVRDCPLLCHDVNRRVSSTGTRGINFRLERSNSRKEERARQDLESIHLLHAFNEDVI